MEKITTIIKNNKKTLLHKDSMYLGAMSETVETHMNLKIFSLRLWFPWPSMPSRGSDNTRDQTKLHLFHHHLHFNFQFIKQSGK